MHILKRDVKSPLALRFIPYNNGVVRMSSRVLCDSQVSNRVFDYVHRNVLAKTSIQDDLTGEFIFTYLINHLRKS